MAVALIVAAGSGERLGAPGPKAFVMLAGKPMVQWSVDALQAVAGVEEVVVALPAGEQAPAGTIGVPGGPSRSASVRAALAAGRGDPVIVHDAARPLAGKDLFHRALAELETTGADGVVAAAPVADTIKLADADGHVVETLDRSRLWAVQTPQVFRRAALEAALGDDVAVAAATDDASLVEARGGDVRLIVGPAENIKVTTEFDLRMATEVLASRAATTPAEDDPLWVVRSFREAINARDFAVVKGLLSPDVRWEREPREDPLAGEPVLVGADAVIRFMEKLHHVWGEFRVIHSDYELIGDGVICEVEVQGRGRRSGASAQLGYTELWTLRNGLVLRRQAFASRDEALRAATAG